jgi:hypothetical protein
MIVDAADWLVLLGLVLVAAALYLWWGLPAALVFAGTVLLIVGLAVALRRPPGKA